MARGVAADLEFTASINVAVALRHGVVNGVDVAISFGVYLLLDTSEH